ncbi:hypothetical protein [Sinorhizobium chiapasense]|uniref:Uncharacterized protein n=1 Tax=Sinorhizobium chiapasense TaxID=501572 RepID=A0ABZ2BDZ9_9HYPH
MRSLLALHTIAIARADGLRPELVEAFKRQEPHGYALPGARVSAEMAGETDEWKAIAPERLPDITRVKQPSDP